MPSNNCPKISGVHMKVTSWTASAVSQATLTTVGSVGAVLLGCKESVVFVVAVVVADGGG